MAPNWVIFPAVAVLAYFFLLLKSSADQRPSTGAASVWVGAWGFASFFAFCAVVWWVSTVVIR